jgi:hypothetical protein
MPPQLWELLRYRDGQSPGAGVFVADDARLLGGWVAGWLAGWLAGQVLGRWGYAVSSCPR